MSDTTLERQLPAPKTDGQLSQSFDFDRRAFVLRVVLCACLGACSIAISIMAWKVVPIVLLFGIALPLTIVVAWFSALRLRMAPPIITIDKNGIWDQRLGMDPIPWQEVQAIELDRDTDVILNVDENFRPVDAEKHEEFLRHLPLRADRQPGRIRIKLDELDTALPEFLAAVDAVLPHRMQAPVCPAVQRRRPRQLVRPLFAGVVSGMMVGLLIVTAGSLRENSTIYRNLGVAGDLGVPPGQSGDVKFGRPAGDQLASVSDARVRLGHFYHEGIGVPRDDARAAHLFAQAATDGVAKGQAALGYFRENGIGIAQDFIKALTWYSKAAAQGDAWAGTRLALMYRDGRGVPRDQAKAFRFFEAAAKKGGASARFYLGEAYENGWGVPENIIAATEWYRVAAAQGHAAAEYGLGSLYRDGRGVSRDEVRAVDWFMKSARKGYAPAQIALGIAYELGLSVERDPKQALFWYYLAEWHGHPAARHRRMLFSHTLSQLERRRANAYRKRWMREKFLDGLAIEKFKEYRRINGPKAFAVSMSGAWVIVDDADDLGNAAQLAIQRCRRSARTCLLYALGDAVVIGIDEPQIDALIARGGKISRR